MHFRGAGRITGNRSGKLVGGYGNLTGSILEGEDYAMGHANIR